MEECPRCRAPVAVVASRLPARRVCGLGGRAGAADEGGPARSQSVTDLGAAAPVAWLALFLAGVPWGADFFGGTVDLLFLFLTASVACGLGAVAGGVMEVATTRGGTASPVASMSAVLVGFLACAASAFTLWLALSFPST